MGDSDTAANNVDFSSLAAPHGVARRKKRPWQCCCLYTMGLSLNSIARLLSVSTPAVLRRVRLFAEKVYERPEPREAVIVKLDEMWHFLGSKKTRSGFGKLIVAIPVNSLTGSVGLVIKPLSQD